MPFGENSETPPPVAVLNLCSGEGKCSDDLRDQLVRTMFRLMGPVQDGHTHLFFKFQSSKYVPAVEKAWPETKWIYLFRDPLEVIASNLKVSCVEICYIPKHSSFSCFSGSRFGLVSNIA